MKNKLHETFHMNYHHMIITWLMNDKREKKLMDDSDWSIKTVETGSFLLRFAKVKVRLLLGGCCLWWKINTKLKSLWVTIYRDLQN